MLRLVSASTRNRDTDRAAREIANRVADRLGGERARAAIFFSTTAHGPGFGAFEREIRTASGATHVVGCSASGVITEDGEVESGAAAAALVFAGDVEVRRFYIPSLRGRAEEVGREVGRIARDLDREPRTLLLLADTYNLAPDELIAGIESVAPGVTIAGAGATEDGSIGETTVVGHGASASNALVGLALGGVRLRTAINSSCSIVGPWWTVTRAQGVRVLEIDERPAARAYRDALPEALRDDLRAALRSTLAAIAQPLGPGEIAAPYLVRPFLGLDPRDESLVVGEEVFAGQKIAIAVRDPTRSRETLDQNLERLASGGEDLAGALYFNGHERGASLYGISDLDSAYVRRRLGDIPLAGFFCGTEFAPLGGRNRMHQFTGVLVGFEPA